MSSEAHGETQGHLRFAHANVGYVLDGLEDATVRYDFERELTPGDVVELLTPNGSVFAVAEVEDVWSCEARLAHHDMVVADGRSHPSEGTLDLLERLKQHYSADVGLTDEVTVIYFDVIQAGPDRAGPDHTDTGTVRVSATPEEIERWEEEHDEVHPAFRVDYKPTRETFGDVTEAEDAE